MTKWKAILSFKLIYCRVIFEQFCSATWSRSKFFFNRLRFKVFQWIALNSWDINEPYKVNWSWKLVEHCYIKKLTDLQLHLLPQNTSLSHSKPWNRQDQNIAEIKAHTCSLIMIMNATGLWPNTHSFSGGKSMGSWDPSSKEAKNLAGNFFDDQNKFFFINIFRGRSSKWKLLN